MKNQLSLSSSTSVSPACAAFQTQMTEHPTRTATVIILVDLLFSLGVGLLAKWLLPAFQPDFVTLVALSFVVALALSGLGWWRVSGFNDPSNWRDTGWMVIPFLVVLGLPFLKGIKFSDGGTFAYLIVGYTLTGFMEEGLMRGIILRILKPLGVNRSVLVSSVLFALLHATNFLFRNPFIVLAQMVGAFVHGIGLAAIRLRTNTIWFVVILHGLHDLCLKYTNFPAIPLDVVQVTLIMLFGIYFLRSWKNPETVNA